MNLRSRRVCWRRLAQTCGQHQRKAWLRGPQPSQIAGHYGALFDAGTACRRVEDRTFSCRRVEVSWASRVANTAVAGRLTAHVTFLANSSGSEDRYSQARGLPIRGQSGVRQLRSRRISNPPSPRGDADGCRRLSGVIEVERRGCGRRRRLERNAGSRPMIGSSGSFAPVFGSGRGNSQRGCSDPYGSDVRHRA